MFKKILIITLLTASACALMNANAALSSGSNDGLTLTPYGWVQKSRVIAVPQNESVGTTPEGNVVLRDIKTNSIIREYAKIPTKNLTFPFNSQHHTKNLHNGNADYPGYTVTADAKDVSVLSTTWAVPKAPKNPRADATFYIFDGLDNGLLQSVLQWGNGSASYMISNWAHINGYFFHGAYLSVLPGDLLNGDLLFDKKDKDGWHYTGNFFDYPVDLHVVLDTKPTGVIESFEPHTTNLDEIPASLCTKMKNILLINKPIVYPINWKVEGIHLPTPSGKNTVIVNNSSSHGEIDFYFH